MTSQHWICSACDVHNLGGSVSSAAPVELWPTCELCGAPTLRLCSDKHKAAIDHTRELLAENARLRDLVRRARKIGLETEPDEGWIRAAWLKDAGKELDQ